MQGCRHPKTERKKIKNTARGHWALASQSTNEAETMDGFHIKGNDHLPLIISNVSKISSHVLFIKTKRPFTLKGCVGI